MVTGFSPKVVGEVSFFFLKAHFAVQVPKKGGNEMKSTRRSGIILTLMLAATLALLIPNAAIAGDHLHKHDCSDGQVLKSQGGEWVCRNDNGTNTDTFADLGCATDEIAKFNGSEWECAADETGSNAGTNIEIVHNSDGYGWYSGEHFEANPRFRVTIVKELDETPRVLIAHEAHAVVPARLCGDPDDADHRGTSGTAAQDR